MKIDRKIHENCIPGDVEARR